MTNDYAKRIAEAVREAAAKKCEETRIVTVGGYYDYDDGQRTLDNAADIIRSLDLDAIIASVPGPWISIKDRLPETFITDDSECWLQGRRINAAINSVRVLVTLEGGGVRVDRLAGIDGNAPYWETYKKRVTHWRPLPAAPTEGKP